MEFYVKSKNNFLIEFILGMEENNKFTGIIIYFNQKFYINENKIYIGNNIEELINDKPIFKEIIDYYDTLVITDINQYIHDNIQDNIIYNSILDMEKEPNGFFYSNKNSPNNFKFKIATLLKTQIETKQTFISKTKQDLNFHLQLRKLNYLYLQSEELKAGKEFSYFLNSYNLEFKN